MSLLTFKIKNQSEFQSVLRKYALLSKRSLAEICNKKAYYINRKAIWFTHKASRAELDANFGVVNLTPGKFRSDGRPSRRLAYGNYALGNYLAQKRGLKLKGAELYAFMKRVFANRLRSIGFIKSGFLPAVNTFKNLFKGKQGLPPMDKDARQRGQPKGGAIEAVEGWRPRALFWNSAAAKHDHVGAVIKYGGAGLQKAFDDETRSTKDEVARRLNEAAKSIGIHTK